MILASLLLNQCTACIFVVAKRFTQLDTHKALAVAVELLPVLRFALTLQLQTWDLP
jgi:hypothetical protein